MRFSVLGLWGPQSGEWGPPGEAGEVGASGEVGEEGGPSISHWSRRDFR